MSKKSVALMEDMNAVTTPEDVLAESEIPLNITSPLHLLEDEFPPIDENGELPMNENNNTENATDTIDDYVPIADEEDKQDITAMDEAMSNIYPTFEHAISYEIVSLRDFAAMKLNAEVAYQRPIVWKETHNDLLIDSILHGFNIGVIYLHGSNLLDGKQRKNCIGLTISGNYQPSTLEGDFEELNGLMICDWPKELQDRFFNAKILLVRLPEEWEEDIAIEQFIRLNRGGKPLTIAQARRGRMIDKLMALKPVINHKAWDMTAKKNNEDVSLYGKIGNAWKEDIIIKLCSSMYGDSDYTAKTLIEWFIKWDMQSHVIKELQARIEKYHSIMKNIAKMENPVPVLRKICKKTHVSAILAAIDDKTDISNAAINLYGFFTSDKSCAKVIEYRKYCEAGTSGKDSVMARVAFIRGIIHE